jgi:hypothetical protein
MVGCAFHGCRSSRRGGPPLSPGRVMARVRRIGARASPARQVSGTVRGGRSPQATPQAKAPGNPPGPLVFLRRFGVDQ